MTSIRNLGEDLQSILTSFASMLEGVYHVDDELAAQMAEKFAVRLRDETRSIYAEMASEIAEGLKKPPKRRRGRSKRVDDSEPTFVENDRSIGTEELPENDQSLLAQINDEMDIAVISEQALRSDKVTNRAGRQNIQNDEQLNPSNPPMRRIR